jgi:hypothetical protein
MVIRKEVCFLLDPLTKLSQGIVSVYMVIVRVWGMEESFIQDYIIVTKYLPS